MAPTIVPHPSVSTTDSSLFDLKSLTSLPFILVGLLVLIEAYLLWARSNKRNRRGRRSIHKCCCDSSPSKLPQGNDRTVLITGASEGLGARLARELARKGTRLVLLCRDTTKAQQQVVDQILRENPTAQIQVHHLDLSSLTSIRVCAAEVLRSEQRIDSLVHCASVAYLKEETRSVDGHELHLATNFLGPFLLNHLLKERMRETADKVGTVVRVINLGSVVHRLGKVHLQQLVDSGIGNEVVIAQSTTTEETSQEEKGKVSGKNPNSSYSPLRSYAQSKLATVLVNREWARRLVKDRVNFYTVDPGLMSDSQSGHYDQLPSTLAYLCSVGRWLIGHSTRKVAIALKGLVLSGFGANTETDQESGYYYRLTSGSGPDESNHYIFERSTPALQATDDRMAASLWAEASRICGLDS